MNEAILLRIFVGFAMLSVASYYDLRSREINDLVWVVFGTGGAFLYIFDSTVSSSTFVGIGLGCLAAFLCWILRLCGGADVLSIITLSVVIPAYNHIPVATVVLLTALVLSLTYAILINICKNTKSLILHRKLFSEIDEPLYKKLFAFFIIHERSKNARYEFSAESVIGQKHKFVFLHEPDSEEFKIARYVTAAIPMMPFMLASFGGFVAVFVSSYISQL